MNEKSTIFSFAKWKMMFAIFLGSIFMQAVLWALYDYFKLPTSLFALSALASALLYYAVQAEKSTKLRRFSVFCMGILLPFLIGCIFSGYFILKYPGMTLSGANYDNLSIFTETIALFAARFTINGVMLLIFSAIEAFLWRLRLQKCSAIEK